MSIQSPGPLPEGRRGIGRRLFATIRNWLHSEAGRRSAYVILGCAALLSLGYAAATALIPGASARDILLFRRLGVQSWKHPEFLGSGDFSGYAPYALVVFWPLGLVDQEILVPLFLAVNIAALALCLLLVWRLWGKGWPADAVFFLCAFYACWVPVRVTLRIGQLSLLVVAAILASELLMQRGRKVTAGLLLGLALVKYSLSGPFLLYLAWRRQWRALAAAMAVPLALTAVYAGHSGFWPWEILTAYVQRGAVVMSKPREFFGGTLEIRPVLHALCGGSKEWATALSLALALLALGAMAWVFYHRPHRTRAHLALLALFSLWVIYHRVYDGVLALLPAALLAEMARRGRQPALAWGGLTSLGLFLLDLPGLLPQHFGLTPQSSGVLGKVAGVGISLQPLMVFGLFWLLLAWLWREESETDN